MHSTVVLPMAARGSTSSTSWRAAARDKRASRLISIPGAMAPPRYSPLAETTSKFVDVPKSTTMAGPPYRWCTDRALAIRSAPTSRGLSARMAMPVRTPGSSTTRGTWNHRLAIARSVAFRLGTVDEMAMPVTASARLRPSSSSSWVTMRACSSAVRSALVAMRQLATRASPSNRPMRVWVLPASRTRSTAGQLLTGPAPRGPAPTGTAMLSMRRVVPTHAATNRRHS